MLNPEINKIIQTGNNIQSDFQNNFKKQKSGSLTEITVIYLFRLEKTEEQALDPLLGTVCVRRNLEGFQ